MIVLTFLFASISFQEKKHKKEKKKSSKKKNKKKSREIRDETSSSSDDSTTIRSVITGKKIKRHIEETYEDRVGAIEREVKRQFINSQY